MMHIYGRTEKKRTVIYRRTDRLNKLLQDRLDKENNKLNRERAAAWDNYRDSVIQSLHGKRRIRPDVTSKDIMLDVVTSPKYFRQAGKYRGPLEDTESLVSTPTNTFRSTTTSLQSTLPTLTSADSIRTKGTRADSLGGSEPRSLPTTQTTQTATTMPKKIGILTQKYKHAALMKQIDAIDAQRIEDKKHHIWNEMNSSTRSSSLEDQHARLIAKLKLKREMLVHEAMDRTESWMKRDEELKKPRKRRRDSTDVNYSESYYMDEGTFKTLPHVHLHHKALEAAAELAQQLKQQEQQTGQQQQQQQQQQQHHELRRPDTRHEHNKHEHRRPPTPPQYSKYKSPAQFNLVLNAIAEWDKIDKIIASKNNERQPIPDYKNLPAKDLALELIKHYSKAISAEAEAMQQYTTSPASLYLHKSNIKAHSRSIRQMIAKRKEIMDKFHIQHDMYMDASENLKCGYLRLTKENIEELERQMLQSGHDPGFHPHLSPSRVREKVDKMRAEKEKQVKVQNAYENTRKSSDKEAASVSSAAHQTFEPRTPDLAHSAYHKSQTQDFKKADEKKSQGGLHRFRKLASTIGKEQATLTRLQERVKEAKKLATKKKEQEQQRRNQALDTFTKDKFNKMVMNLTDEDGNFTTLEEMIIHKVREDADEAMEDSASIEDKAKRTLDLRRRGLRRDPNEPSLRSRLRLNDERLMKRQTSRC